MKSISKLYRACKDNFKDPRFKFSFLFFSLFCKLIQQQKRGHTYEYWQGMDPLLSLGVPLSPNYFLPCAASILTPCFLPTR